MIVPRFKHTAVARNRLKRRLRELARRTLLPGAPAVDLVIRTRREAYGARFEQLSTEVAQVRRAVEQTWGVGRWAVGGDRTPPSQGSTPSATENDTPPARGA